MCHVTENNRIMLIMLDRKITEAHRKRLGENIRRARKAAGLKQRDLAKALGCETSTITHYESGFRPVACDILRIIADTIGTTAADLIDPDRNGICKNATPEQIALAKKAIEVLVSGSQNAELLRISITTLHESVTRERTIENRLTAVEKSITGGPPPSGADGGDTRTALPEGHRIHR